MKLRALWSTVVAVALGGCTGSVVDEKTTSEFVRDPRVTVEQVRVAPVAGPVSERQPVTGGVSPTRLALVEGRVTVGTTTGLLTESATAPMTFPALTLSRLDGEPEATGQIQWLTRRPGGGLLVSATRGLFHDSEGQLRFSPVTASLPALATVIDAAGARDAEELWMVPADAANAPRVLYLAEGQLSVVRLGGSVATAVPEAAVGVAPGVGLVAAGGALYQVELASLGLTLLVDGLGAVRGFDRGGDGALYFATDAGVLVRKPDGAITLHSLAAEGSAPTAALSVQVAYGDVWITTADSLLLLGPEGPVRLAARTQGPAGHAAAIGDALGDTWLIDGDQLVRLATGTPVSYAADVKPFLAGHCTKGCHNSGGALPRPFIDDYAAAKTFAQQITCRLQAQGCPVMPPASTEVLTPAQYALVLRWVAGGMKP